MIMSTFNKIASQFAIAFYLLLACTTSIWAYLPPPEHITKQVVRKRADVKKAAANYHIVYVTNGSKTTAPYDLSIQWNDSKIVAAQLVSTGRDQILKKLNISSLLLNMYFSNLTLPLANFLEKNGYLEKSLVDANVDTEQANKEQNKENSKQVTLKRAFGKICYQIKNLKNEHLSFLVEKDSYLPIFFSFHPDGESISLEMQTDHFMTLSNAHIPKQIHLSKDGSPWIDLEFADSRELKVSGVINSDHELPENIAQLYKWML